jgi:hypothetical protein
MGAKIGHVSVFSIKLSRVNEIAGNKSRNRGWKAEIRVNLPFAWTQTIG